MVGNLVVTDLSRQSIDKTLHFVFLLSCRFHFALLRLQLILFHKKGHNSSCSLLMSKTKIKLFFVIYNLFENSNLCFQYIRKNSMDVGITMLRA